MEKLTKVVAKINVLKCEPKLDQNQRQDFDKEGNKLWNIFIREQVFNEEFNEMESLIKRYKTLEELPVGEHIVEVKMSSMGQGSGDFVSVNKYFTVLRKIQDTATLKDIFGTQGVVPPTKRKLADKGASAVQ